MARQRRKRTPMQEEELRKRRTEPFLTPVKPIETDTQEFYATPGKKRPVWKNRPRTNAPAQRPGKATRPAERPGGGPSLLDKGSGIGVMPRPETAGEAAANRKRMEESGKPLLLDPNYGRGGGAAAPTQAAEPTDRVYETTDEKGRKVFKYRPSEEQRGLREAERAERGDKPKLGQRPPSGIVKGFQNRMANKSYSAERKAEEIRKLEQKAERYGWDLRHIPEYEQVHQARATKLATAEQQRAEGELLKQLPDEISSSFTQSNRDQWPQIADDMVWTHGREALEKIPAWRGLMRQIRNAPEVEEGLDPLKQKELAESTKDLTGEALDAALDAFEAANPDADRYPAYTGARARRKAVTGTEPTPEEVAAEEAKEAAEQFHADILKGLPIEQVEEYLRDFPIPADTPGLGAIEQAGAAAAGAAGAAAAGAQAPVPRGETPPSETDVRHAAIAASPILTVAYNKVVLHQRALDATPLKPRQILTSNEVLGDLDIEGQPEQARKAMDALVRRYGEAVRLLPKFEAAELLLDTPPSQRAPSLTHEQRTKEMNFGFDLLNKRQEDVIQPEDMRAIYDAFAEHVRAGSPDAGDDEIDALWDAVISRADIGIEAPRTGPRKGPLGVAGRRESSYRDLDDGRKAAGQSNAIDQLLGNEKKADAEKAAQAKADYQAKLATGVQKINEAFDAFDDEVGAALRAHDWKRELVFLSMPPESGGALLGGVAASMTGAVGASAASMLAAGTRPDSRVIEVEGGKQVRLTSLGGGFVTLSFIVPGGQVKHVTVVEPSESEVVDQTVSDLIGTRRPGEPQ